MKKLILSIVLPITMVCCQSENNIEEIKVFEEKETVYNCLYASVYLNEIVYVGDHWNNNPTMNNYVNRISDETFFHHFCFDQNKYKISEMFEIVEGKYPNADSYIRGEKIIKKRF